MVATKGRCQKVMSLLQLCLIPREIHADLGLEMREGRPDLKLDMGLGFHFE